MCAYHAVQSCDDHFEGFALDVTDNGGQLRISYGHRDKSLAH